MQHSLDEVVIVPRNGYVNRLQAWASAAILAARLDVPLRVAWEVEEAAPAPANELFAGPLVSRHFWDVAQLEARLGGRHDDLPRYLHVDEARRLVTLAGHDRGEQVFMESLEAILSDDSGPQTLVIVAGGKFHLPKAQDFVRQRCQFYQALAWHPEIDQRFAAERKGRSTYVALHIRETDRSREAPTARTIRAGLLRLRESSGERSLFIAADTPGSRDHWATAAAELGFDPWSVVDVDHDRSRASSARDAIVDWRLLGASRALVYTAASSFGEEASVASGNFGQGIALAATARRQQARALRDLAHSAAGYPQRRGWLGGTTG